MKNAQRSVLNSLISPARLARLVEVEAIDAKGAYPATEFLADVRKGIWKELEGAAPVKVDAYRRNLQRAYLDLMNDRLNRPAAAAPSFPGFTPPPTTEDVRPFFRGELKTLSAAVTAAAARATDRATRLHLDDVKDQIAKILDPKIVPPAATGAAGTTGRGYDPLEEWLNPRTCWPDYIIRR